MRHFFKKTKIHVFFFFGHVTNVYDFSHNTVQNSITASICNREFTKILFGVAEDLRLHIRCNYKLKLVSKGRF